MNYTRIFNPQPLLQDFRKKEEKITLDVSDRRDGKIYLYDEKIVLAVNIALATGRPLLVSGPPGSGKSSLAYNVARVMKRRYYEHVITTRTQARDLLWHFDAVRRLGDAQIRGKFGETTLPWDTYYPYIEPGVLWWVFDRNSARNRGQREIAEQGLINQTRDIAIYDPHPDVDNNRAVVLVDEIDKADPDVPNNLLVPLGSLKFTVEEIQLTVEFKKTNDTSLELEDLPLIIITTNQERQLPKAFTRRCVTLEIGSDPERLVEIAKATEGVKHEAIYRKVIKAMQNSVGIQGEAQSVQPSLSVAEFLDAVRACLRLKIDTDSEMLKEIIGKTIWKQPASLK